MLKIAVFDGGCGGEAVADYLAGELGVVEITRVIDGRSDIYEKKQQPELNKLVERRIKPYIGKMDLIVLGGYTVSLALDYLCNKYPYQKFVGMGVNYYRILKSSSYPMHITAIMNETLLKSAFCDELKDNLPFSTLAIPDCSGWGCLAQKGRLSTDVMQMDLQPYFDLHPIQRPVAPPPAVKPKNILETMTQQKQPDKPSTEQPPRSVVARPVVEQGRLIPSDVVLILNTCLWGLKREIEDVFGYKVRVLDFRQKLLHDVCVSLNLLGVDGERSK